MCAHVNDVLEGTGPGIDDELAQEAARIWAELERRPNQPAAVHQPPPANIQKTKRQLRIEKQHANAAAAHARKLEKDRIRQQRCRANKKAAAAAAAAQQPPPDTAADAVEDEVDEVQRENES